MCYVLVVSVVDKIELDAVKDLRPERVLEVELPFVLLLEPSTPAMLAIGSAQVPDALLVHPEALLRAELSSPRLEVLLVEENDLLVDLVYLVPHVRLGRQMRRIFRIIRL